MLRESRTSEPGFLLASLLTLTFLAACRPSSVQTPAAATSTPLPQEATEERGIDPFDGVDLAITGVDGNVLLADVESKKVISLTDDAMLDPLEGETFISYAEPTWSPADGRLAFIRTVREQDKPAVVDIIVRGPGQEEIMLGAESERPFYLYWSPKGEQLSFLASSPGEPISLWVKDLSGQGGRVDRGQPYYWDWSPSGSRLFAHVGGSIDLNPDGAYLSFFQPEREELELAPLSFQAPAFSPDGDQILVSSRARAGSDSLLLLDEEGQISQEVVSVEGRASFGWAPSGSHFAVSIGPDIGGVHIGDLTLFSVDAQGNARLERKIAEDVVAFWWSPDAEKIAYFVPLLSPPDLTQPVSLNAQGEDDLLLQLFVFDLESTASQRLASFRPTAEFLRIMPYYDQYQRSATLWSADSSFVAYATSGPQGSGQIFIISVDGSEPPKHIGSGQIAYWARQPQ